MCWRTERGGGKQEVSYNLPWPCYQGVLSNELYHSQLWVASLDFCSFWALSGGGVWGGSVCSISPLCVLHKNSHSCNASVKMLYCTFGLYQCISSFMFHVKVCCSGTGGRQACCIVECARSSIARNWIICSSSMWAVKSFPRVPEGKRFSGNDKTF